MWVCDDVVGVPPVGTCPDAVGVGDAPAVGAAPVDGVPWETGVAPTLEVPPGEVPELKLRSEWALCEWPKNSVLFWVSAASVPRSHSTGGR